ncbi:MAG TPA: YggT family protein [Acidimicrobiales bacterium]|jgi:YggT family protein|nr:YggT family protein [Acidimicrobiales bacterium]
MRFIQDILTLYILILFVTALLSWVPQTSAQGGLATTQRILSRITEPVLRPLRSILPRPNFGGVSIDLSVLIAIVALEIIKSII